MRRRGVGSKVVKMQMRVSPEKLPAVIPSSPSPKRFQIDESQPYAEFPVLVRSRHGHRTRREGRGDTRPYIIPVEGRDFIAFQFQPKWFDGGWRSLNRGGGSSRTWMVVGCRLIARYQPFFPLLYKNKISIRYICRISCSKKNSYWQPEKCRIRSLRGLWNALSGMLSTCPLARTWRIQMQIKACERMREKAKDESIHEGLSVSSHRADRESDREEKDLSLFLSCARRFN